ncbi:Nudix hydrolase 8 [Anthophora plagiata]
MASMYFKGHDDHYNGVTIDSNEEFCTSEEFAQRLKTSLQQWIQVKKRTIWFRVYLAHSEWVPILVKEGFKFHHAKQEYVMLYRWLVTDEECNVPHYAHTNLGVGGFVYNEETKEVLVIKEKYSNRKPLWKLPGGYVEPGEDLEEAVKREILEETGVKTTFKCIIGFRHIHDYAFGCSDIYIIAYLSPIHCNIKKCEKEISDCKWMKVQDYLEHPEVHENNKLIVKKMLEFFKHRMGVTVEYALHPISQKPICVYSISKINNA